MKGDYSDDSEDARTINTLATIDASMLPDTFDINDENTYGEIPISQIIHGAYEPDDDETSPLSSRRRKDRFRI